MKNMKNMNQIPHSNMTTRFGSCILGRALDGITSLKKEAIGMVEMRMTSAERNSKVFELKHGIYHDSRLKMGSSQNGNPEKFQWQFVSVCGFFLVLLDPSCNITKKSCDHNCYCLTHCPCRSHSNQVKP